jgi:hypothetical protein
MDVAWTSLHTIALFASDISFADAALSVPPPWLIRNAFAPATLNDGGFECAEEELFRK